MVNPVGGGSGTPNTSALQQWQENLFKKMDANGDGSLTKAEASKVLPANGPSVDAVFAVLDANSDGAVTRSEFDAGTAKMAQQAQGSQAAGGRPPGGGPSGAAKSSLSYDVRDTNQDGVVSPQEEFAYNLTHPPTDTAGQQLSETSSSISQIDVTV